MLVLFVKHVVKMSASREGCSLTTELFGQTNSIKNLLRGQVLALCMMK